LPAVFASLAGFILLLQPSLAFVWDVLLFQRPTSLMNWVGVSIVLFAIYLGSVKPSQS
jgi:drug/metabolite transporter (DMT)-like permease